jgi:ketosteroid isomerase-like protein
MPAILTILALVLSAVPVLAETQSGPMAAVEQFMSALNSGDTNRAVAACASPAAIVDEFPPHEWQGARACSDWLNAFDAFDKTQGITDDHVTLHHPLHVEIAGDRAYIVVPADYSYERRGKPILEAGSILTVALKMYPGGWRITGWAWAKR